MFSIYKLRQNKIAVKIKDMIPKSIRAWIYNLRRETIFKKAIKELKFNLENDREITEHLLFNLYFGWGNTSFSSDTSYLSAIIYNTKKGRLNILECGSGLSTIVMGIVGDIYQNKIIVLEHHKTWFHKLNEKLKELNIKSVELHFTPLKSYDNYEWYDISRLKNEMKYDIVICDGPPAQTKGGRYGLLELMDKNINKKGLILLDDFMRSEEKEIVKSWVNHFTYSFDADNSTYVFAVLIKH
jgi:hypothetical protein